MLQFVHFIAATLLTSNVAPTNVEASSARLVEPEAVTLYRATNDRLLERIHRGLRAAVHIEKPDGTIQDGFDEYAIDDQIRLHEVRPDRESIVVGKTYCNFVDAEALDCRSIGEIELGLRAIHDDRIYRAQRWVAPCGASTCAQVDIEEWGQDEDDAPTAESGGAPRHKSHYSQHLLVRDDGLPYSLEEARLNAGGLVEPRATFLFDYETPITPIDAPELPPGV